MKDEPIWVLFYPANVPKVPDRMKWGDQGGAEYGA